MQVRHLTLSNFRNYATADIALQPGVNVLVGANGQGKTNLVEAIQYVSTLRSHRVAGYEALIRLGQPQAIVRLLARWQDRENLIEIELNRDSPNRAKRRQEPPPRDSSGACSKNEWRFPPGSPTRQRWWAVASSNHARAWFLRRSVVARPVCAARNRRRWIPR